MGTVTGLGTPGANFSAYGTDDPALTERLVELLAEGNERLLTAYVDDESAVSGALLRAELTAQLGQGRVYPVFFGSAVTGAGVAALTAGITALLPTARGDADGPASGSVFKVERGRAGEKIAFVRMFSGAVRTRDRLRLRDADAKVTAISVVDGGEAVARDVVSAGEIGKLWGLGAVRIGDSIGDRELTGDRADLFPKPTLETVVVPVPPADRGALKTALSQLAEQDPLINLRQDDLGRKLSVSLYGEVQKEVIQATLANEYGIDATFRETTTIYLERPVGVGTGLEILRRAPNPFLATVGLRVEPGTPGSGIEFRLDLDAVESIPMYVFRQVDEFRATMTETVNHILEQGLHGWAVTDCVVTMTDCGYHSPGTSAADFRKLTPLVLMSALRQAGTVVCEPIHRFRIDAPADTLGGLLAAAAQLGATPEDQSAGDSTCILSGFIPAVRVRELGERLPGLTHGEGTLESELHHHQPISGRPPTRPRSDHNPLDRKEYLLWVERMVAVRR